jgi:hypothetical protein
METGKMKEIMDITKRVIKEIKRRKDIEDFYKMAVRYGFIEGNPVVERRVLI